MNKRLTQLNEKKNKSTVDRFKQAIDVSATNILIPIFKSKNEKKM